MGPPPPEKDRQVARRVKRIAKSLKKVNSGLDPFLTPFQDLVDKGVLIRTSTLKVTRYHLNIEGRK